MEEGGFEKMPKDLYAAYNSLSVAQKQEAYNFIMLLSSRNKQKKETIKPEIQNSLDKMFLMLNSAEKEENYRTSTPWTREELYER